MTNEEKQLLLIDLSAKLLYGVKIQVKEWTTLDTELKIGHIQRLQNDEIELKPYLRPMSSMTEEERKEMKKLWFDNNKAVFADPREIRCYRFYDFNVVDWLNAHHFDYRGLIEKGLALEAPEGMYN